MGKVGKGYQKPQKKQRYFTKKDVGITVAILLALIAVIAILAVVIGKDDFIRKKDGKLVMEDNWLVANFSETTTAQYYQVGTLGEVEGYTLEAESAGAVTKALRPEAEDSDISVIYVAAVGVDQETLAKSLAAQAEGLTTAEVMEPEDRTFCGRNGKFFCYEQVTGEGEEAVSSGSVAYALMPYDDQHCIHIQVNATVVLMDADAQALLTQVANAITIIER